MDTSIEELFASFITLLIYLALMYYTIATMNSVLFIMESLASKTYIY